MLLLTGGIPLLFIVAGGIYEWNNRVQDVKFAESKLPQPNAYDYYEKAARNFVEPAGNAGIDVQFESRTLEPVKLFSPDYNQRYPLAVKQSFLSQNEPILRLLQQGHPLPYRQPPQRYGPDYKELPRYRALERLMITDSHAHAQRGDWNGAANRLLDLLHLGYRIPNGGGIGANLLGQSIRTKAYDEYIQLMPHFSPAQARIAISKLQAWQKSQANEAQAYEEDKQQTIDLLLQLTRKRDFRPLFVVYGCLEPCDVSDEQYQSDLNSLSPWLKMQLAWINKPRLVQEHIHWMDWYIMQSKKPYPLRDKVLPPHKNVLLFPGTSDQLAYLIYPELIRFPQQFTVSKTRDVLLTTMLALHAYRQEKGYYPATLNDLLPRHLSQVPLDPFSNNQPLCYRPTVTRYLVSRKSVPNPIPKGYTEPGGSRTVEQYTQMPYTLYSIGLNMVDDGGALYESKPNDDVRRYKVDLSLPDTAKADIVAGINK